VRNVLDTYHAEWTAAKNPLDPDRPALLDTVTGQFKVNVRRTLAEDRAEGVYAQRADGSTILHRTDEVRFETINMAIAVECVIDDLVTYDRSNAPIDTRVVTSFKNTTLVREEDGAWRISERETQAGGGSCPGLR
jgi:hypothetical protein